MVRIGTLPTRLLSLEYGASLVWGPEIVDRAIIDCVRTVDKKTGVISYNKPAPDGRFIWSTHPIEKERVIFQLGSADPELALKAAKVIMDDVAGIGLNCGCPKPFSVKGGMGAALLSEPDRLCSILRSLCTLPVPIDAKIRLLPSVPETLSLVEQILTTGIANLTVHARFPAMRDIEPALFERLREVVDTVGGRVNVVANGDCQGGINTQTVIEATGVSACMIARAAEANPSCFLPGPLLPPITTVLPFYIRIAHATQNAFANSKYCIGAMDLSKGQEGGNKKERGRVKGEFNRAKTYKDLGAVVGLELVDGEKVGGLEELLPNWVERRKEILRKAAEDEGNGAVKADEVEVAKEGKVVASSVEVEDAAAPVAAAAA